MRNVALSTLLLRTRRRVDIESATTRFPDAEITDALNEGIAELWERINKVTGHDSYYRSSRPFTTNASQSAYPAPPDFYKLISIDVQVGSTNLILVARPYMENERNRFKSMPTGWNYGAPVYYAMVGSNINFIPNPSGGYVVTLNYVPTPPVLANTSDVIDGIAGWEEYPILWAAIRCAIKDKDWETKAALDQELEKMRARIDDMAAERDNQPERVHDVTGDANADLDFGMP